MVKMLFLLPDDFWAAELDVDPPVKEDPKEYGSVGGRTGRSGRRPK